MHIPTTAPSPNNPLNTKRPKVKKIEKVQKIEKTQHQEEGYFKEVPTKRKQLDWEA